MDLLSDMVQSVYESVVVNKAGEFAPVETETKSFTWLSHSCFGSSALVACAFPIHPG